jgi:hypothetical protein
MTNLLSEGQNVIFVIIIAKLLKKSRVDVVAINWHEKQVLLGECKWDLDSIDRQIVRELIEQKKPRAMAALPDGGDGWRVHYVIFARSGFTSAARVELQKFGGIAVDLGMLERDLSTS